MNSPRESTAPSREGGVEMNPDATSDALLGPEFLPLRGLANILTVLLAVVVAFICARLAIHLFSPGSMHYFFDTDMVAGITMLALTRING
jgi:hypothetical protein